jgi:four helix bundle protein
MSGQSGSDLRQRTKSFALRVIQLVGTLPKTQTANIIGRQLLRSGTSVGANYRAARRARSNAEFIAKLGIVEEEIDECAYWLELLHESRQVAHEEVKLLHAEADELTAIIVTSINSAKQHKVRPE